MAHPGLDVPAQGSLCEQTPDPAPAITRDGLHAPAGFRQGDSFEKGPIHPRPSLLLRDEEDFSCAPHMDAHTFGPTQILRQGDLLDVQRRHNRLSMPVVQEPDSLSTVHAMEQQKATALTISECLQDGMVLETPGKDNLRSTGLANPEKLSRLVLDEDALRPEGMDGLRRIEWAQGIDLDRIPPKPIEPGGSLLGLDP